MTCAVLRIFAAAAATLAAGVAWAVPPAVGSTNCGLGSYFGNPESCDSDTVQASRTLSPDPAVSANIVYSGSGLTGGGAELTYYFTVDGPNASAAIPIDVDYRLAGVRNASTVDFFSQIVVQPNFSNGDGGDSKTLCTSSDFAICTAGFGGSEAGTIHVVSSVGELGSVYINAAVSAGYLPAEQTGSALVDPFIHIDHSFADYASYSVEVSPGVGNAPIVAGVPEPTMWAMMMLGLGAAGGALRSRRRPIAGGVGV